MKIETVRVVHGDAYKVINVIDFDPSVHVVYYEDPAESENLIPFVDSIIHVDPEYVAFLGGLSWVQIRYICTLYGLQKQDNQTWHDLIPDLVPVLAENNVTLEDLVNDYGESA